MPEMLRYVPPPSGLSRLLYRSPIYLYRMGLGWMLGGRFLLLEHIGRVSSFPRQTVLEVVRHDATDDVYYVAAAWGEQADWFRNLQAQPAAVIQTGRRKLHVQSTVLSSVEAAQELLDYAQRNPTAARSLSRLLGYRIEGPQDFAGLAEWIRIVALRNLNRLQTADQPTG
jgi:deazaflavin-dependent oxidoreductase (nitroreductase family)